MRRLDYPPVYLAACLVVAWATSTPSISVGAQVVALIGQALVVLGLLIAAMAVFQMNRQRTTVIPHRVPDALVTSGVFAKSRNPIYLGDVMILLGASLYWFSLPGILLIPALVLVLQMRFIQPEEQRMSDAFGAGFHDYAARTRRWL